MSGAFDSKQAVSPLDAGLDAPTIPAKRRRKSWRLSIGVATAALAGCGMFTLGAIYVPKVIRAVEDFQEDTNDLWEEWYDEGYDGLMAALWERWGLDDSIPNAAADFEFWTYSDRPSEVWFVIELETTTRCTLRAGDPCQALVDEFAGIVLENYPRADELDKLHIIVSHITDAGVIEFTRSLDEARSIQEWRRLLDAVKEETGTTLPGSVEHQL